VARLGAGARARGWCLQLPISASPTFRGCAHHEHPCDGGLGYQTLGLLRADRLRSARRTTHARLLVAQAWHARRSWFIWLLLHRTGTAGALPGSTRTGLARFDGPAAVPRIPHPAGRGRHLRRARWCSIYGSAGMCVKFLIAKRVFLAPRRSTSAGLALSTLTFGSSMLYLVLFAGASPADSGAAAQQYGDWIAMICLWRRSASCRSSNHVVNEASLPGGVWRDPPMESTAWPC